ncbi:MAG: M48 family metallopeptidase [Opitutae bacterium]|nr:M48 family metallopeptidase [Opitutae bacterium]
MSLKGVDTELLAIPTTEGAELMPVLVRRSNRARRLRLTIGVQGEAILTIPRGCSRAEGIKFLHKHGDWMKKHLGNRKKKSALSLMEFLQKQGWLSFAGKKYSIKISFGNSSRIKFMDDFLCFFLNRDGDEELELVGLLRQLASEKLKTRTWDLAEEKQLSLARISVRNQKSRWGSCSDRGTVSLNWRLLLIRPDLQDYIILHELAHLTEMNHSGTFWLLLETYDIQARKHDREVTKISREIMSLGR